MTYQHTWWVPKTEYGAGLNAPKTWPSVMDQYRRPNDARYYDLPTEQYSHKLYYEYPRMGMPKYRGLFRDKPHTVNSDHPSATMKKPVGFHGRVYYEHSKPQFKYEGAPKDDLYWLERPPLLPSFPHVDSKALMDQMCQRGLNGKALSTAQSLKIAADNGVQFEQSRQASQMKNSYTPPRTISADASNLTTQSAGHWKRISQDGVGYL